MNKILTREEFRQGLAEICARANARWSLPDGQEIKTQDDSGLGPWLAHNDSMTHRTNH